MNNYANVMSRQVQEQKYLNIIYAENYIKLPNHYFSSILNTFVWDFWITPAVGKKKILVLATLRGTFSVGTVV